MILDEIQTGLGRTGRFLACDHEGVRPDGLILGKALGGGLLPVSLFLSRHEVMDVFGPGDHGSTFGGNPLAATIGLRALELLFEEELIERSQRLGAHLKAELELLKLKAPCIQEVRGRGLFVGLELNPNYAQGRDICLKLLAAGLLTYETHETVIRLAPPLVITEEQLNEAIQVIKDVLTRETVSE